MHAVYQVYILVNPESSVCPNRQVYREFVTGFGLEFYPIGGDPKVLSEFVVKHRCGIVWDCVGLGTGCAEGVCVDVT